MLALSSPNPKPTSVLEVMSQVTGTGDRTCFDPVIYLLTEIETETEMEIMSLTETKRETEMFSKTETKYKRTSQRTKRNIN